jgi:hypothetical protein
VLFTTGYARDVQVAGAIVQAGEGQIFKPFTVDQLAAKVRSLLDA